MASTLSLYFQMWVWTDDTKTQLLTPQPVTRFFRVYRNMALNLPYEYQITCFLTDAVAGTIGQGNYAELYVGKTTNKGAYPPPDQKLWANGYIETVTKNVSRNNQFEIVMHSALLSLAHIRDLGALIMDYPHFKDAIQALTGINPAGSPAIPGQKGILSGSGWEHNVVWTTPNTPPITVTLAQPASAGDNELIFNSTSQLKAGQTLHMGADRPRIYQVLDGQKVSLWSNIANNYPQGTTVTTSTYVIPGQGDSWRTDWSTQLLNLQTMAQMYGFWFRERPGSLAHNGTLDVGPLGDDSGLKIWGGDALVKDLGQPFVDAQGNVIARPNAALAQQKGYAVIESASQEIDTSNIYNLVWAAGAGNGDTLVTIATSDGFQGPPLDKNGNPQYGWQVWQPYGNLGRTYYLKSNNIQHWHGGVYELIASQQQDGHWAYGVVDRSSVLGDANNPVYGIREYQLHNAKIHDGNLLLSAALGTLYSNAKPVNTWQFEVKHPQISPSQIPYYPLPGQTVDVHYQGAVWSNEIDGDPSSPTFGQPIPSSERFTYLQYPNTADPDVLEKVKKVVTFEDEWSGKQYTQTITMGKIKRSTKHFLNDLAGQFEHQKHARRTKTSFTFHALDHISFYFSKNPDAFEDKTNEQVTFNPGSSIVSNTPDSSYFGDNRSVDYLVTLTDKNQTFDFWFAKPIDGTVTSPIGSGPYGVFRLAMTGSSNQCGFHIANTDGSFTRVGQYPNVKMFDSKGRLPAGQYRVKVSWSKGIYEAHIAHIRNGDNVWHHELACLWHDKDAKITTWGAIGWHLLGGSTTAEMGELSMHPHHKKSRASHGGRGTRHSTIVEKSGGGSELVQWDKLAQQFLRTHRFHADGTLHHAGQHVHGHGQSGAMSATIGSISGTNPATVTFAGTLTGANELKTGWIVMDGSGNWGVVASVTRDKNGNITGFTSNDPGVAAMVAGANLIWDALEPDGAPQHGHKAFGMWNPPTHPGDTKGGWAKVIRPADAPADGTGDFIIYPDGSTAKGDKPLTQKDGAVINLQSLSVGAGAFAKGIEQQGKMLFDAGEYESATQAVALYPTNGGTNPIITVGSNGFVGSGKQDLFEGATTTITSPASWASATTDNKTGETDAILALTAGTFGGKTYNTVRWYDTQILEPDGTQRKNTVRHDVSLEIPLYMGVAQGSPNLVLGAHATWGFFTAVSADGYPETTLDIDDGTLAQCQPGDTWVINPGGATQETLTVHAVDQPGGGLIWTTQPVYGHAQGELLLMKTANGGTTTVHSGILADGNIALDDTASAIDCIAIGYWDGTNWYRGYWGDPVWGATCEYSPGAIQYLGPLKSIGSDWTKLAVKASALGLYAPNAKPVTIIGCEVAIHSANPGAGVSVYFDAHRHGHAPSKGQMAPGSVGSNQIANGAVKQKHKTMAHHADAHQHSDLTYWVDTANVLHWESGYLVDVKGNVYNIFGGTEDTPNTGISGVTAGDYLVFNSSASSVQIKDPVKGVVTVPGYVAGDAGHQTIGFALLSESFDWTKRAGGGTIKYGPPDTLFKVGKVGHTADTYTGELPVHSHHGAGKKHAKHVRKGAVAAKHLTKQHPLTFVPSDIIFTTYLSDQTPNSVGQCSLSWTTGTYVPHTGSGNGITINGGNLNNVWSGYLIAYDTSAHAIVTLADTTDMTLDSNARYAFLGRINKNKDAHSGQYPVQSNHSNVHQTHGIHHATHSHGKVHDHNHKPHKHVYRDVIFSLTSGTLYWTAGALIDDTNTTIATISAGSLGGVSAGQIIVFNSSSSGISIGGTTVPANSIWTINPSDLTSNLAIPLFEIGKVSTLVDPHTGQNFIHGRHGGSHQVHGAHHAAKSVGRRASHPIHHKHRHHHHDMTYVVSGSTLSWSNSNGGIYDDSGNLIGVPSNTSCTFATGQIIVYNASGSTWNGIPNGNIGAAYVTDLTQDSAVGIVEIGRISDLVDSYTGNAQLQGHHHGPHQVHGKHVQPSAVIGSHMNYTVTQDWFYMGSYGIYGNATSGNYYISNSISIGETPPFSIKRMHAGQWEIGASSVGSQAPDGGASEFHHNHHSTGGNVVVAPSNLDVTNAITCADTNQKVLVNSVGRNQTNGTLEVKFQLLTQYTDGVQRQIYIFARWHGHNPN